MHDSFSVARNKDAFEAACGPLNLGEALHMFRIWSDGDAACRGRSEVYR